MCPVGAFFERICEAYICMFIYCAFKHLTCLCQVPVTIWLVRIWKWQCITMCCLGERNNWFIVCLAKWLRSRIALLNGTLWDSDTCRECYCWFVYMVFICCLCVLYIACINKMKPWFGVLSLMMMPCLTVTSVLSWSLCVVHDEWRGDTTRYCVTSLPVCVSVGRSPLPTLFRRGRTPTLTSVLYQEPLYPAIDRLSVRVLCTYCTSGIVYWLR